MPRCSYPRLDPQREASGPGRRGGEGPADEAAPTPEAELELLKGRAEDIRRELDEVEGRVRELESE